MAHLTVLRAAVSDMFIGSRRGAVFVEAALVFPLLIFIIALIISYTIMQYEEIKKQVENHSMQREASMNGEIISKGECEFVRNIDFLLEEI